MGYTLPPVAAGFVELPDVPVIYCSGASAVLLECGNLQWTLYREQVAADGTRERVVFARAVMPEKAWLALRDMTEFEIVSAGHPIQISTLRRDARM